MHQKTSQIKKKTDFNFWANFFLFFIVILLDRVTKIFVLGLEGEIKLLPFVEIVLVKNKGIVFGLFSDSNINSLLVIIMSIISVILITLIFYKFSNKTLFSILSVIVGGATGNILDRILYGYVVDFIKIGSFYVFNLADASITIGCILMIIYVIFYAEKFKNI